MSRVLGSSDWGLDVHGARYVCGLLGHSIKLSQGELGIPSLLCLCQEATQPGGELKDADDDRIVSRSPGKAAASHSGTVVCLSHRQMMVWYALKVLRSSRTESCRCWVAQM